MTIRYPIDETDYKGTVRFNNLGPGENIELYLPSSLEFGDKVEYENIGIGALFATGVDAFQGRGRDPSTLSMGDLTTGFEDRATLGVLAAISKFSDKGAAAARDATRTAPNPNTRAIFKQVNLRQFQMTFKLIPNSEREADAIGRLITEFRKTMYPEEIEGNFGYKFPDRFQIEVCYDGMVLEDYNLMTEECYLESVMSNYNPSSQAFMKYGAGKGYFSEIDLSLTFMEAKTLHRKSVEGGL